MKTMFSLLCAMMLICSIFSIAQAGDVPTRTTITNATSTAATYTVPAFANGDLQEIRVYDASDAVSTCTVAQVVAVTTTRSLTNTLYTIVTAANSGVVRTGINSTNGPLAWLVPGDILRFTMTGAATGQISLTRKVSNP